MDEPLHVVVGLLVWVFLGCVVLATADVRGELLVWTRGAPRKWMGHFVILFWPVVVCIYLFRTGGRDGTR